MTEISVVAQEIAASRQRGIPADPGKLLETLRLDAERAAAGEEMLRGFLDLVVLRHDGFASGLGLLWVQKGDDRRNAPQRARCADSGLSPRWVVTPIADLRRYDHIGSDGPTADSDT
jgi:hypothetical protein